VDEWGHTRATVKEPNEAIFGWIWWVRFDDETTSHDRAMVIVVMNDDALHARDCWRSADGGCREIRRLSAKYMGLEFAMVLRKLRR